MSLLKSVVISISVLFFAGPTLAQNSFFKFKISEEGVYKLTPAQANQLGIPHDQLAFFGYPGMLPQRLDSTNLTLQEIPSLVVDGELWVYLKGPHQVSYSLNGEVRYTHHFFEDSLNYLIGQKTNPKRIENQPNSDSGMIEFGNWYQWKALKGEQINVLNSGKTWFSNPIRQSQSLNFSLSLSSTANRPWILTGNLMTQSFASSTMRVLSGNELLAEVAFDPIPNATYGIKGQEKSFLTEFTPVNGNLSQIRFTFQGSGGNSAGYLDYVLVGMPAPLQNLPSGLIQSTQAGKIEVPSDRFAWEVGDFYQPQTTSSLEVAVGREFYLFSLADIKSIPFVETVSLATRASGSSELLIVTHPTLRSAAQKLQRHKTSLGISTEILTTEEVYNSYGYGNEDLTAIRNAIAHRYQESKTLKNVLILGKGTFDYKGKLGGRPNLVPIYTSRNSLNPLQTYSSDDFLGLIDWGQGVWEESREGDELLQIGVGRIPAINFTEANLMVDKIIAYETGRFDPSIFPSFTLLADDADNAIHMRDSESHAAYLEQNHGEIKIDRLYLDAFEQIQAGNRQQSPQAKAALETNLQKGPLVVNYVGHGNETTLMAEEVFTVSDISEWAKQNPMALWVTATCEFGRQDSPLLRSGAEELLFASQKGAIGLLTTGRPVFSSVNFQLNEAFVRQVFRKAGGQSQDLGTIFKETKNQSLNGVLNRNFSLLGDPSLKLAAPELEIAINGFFKPSSTEPQDTLIALEEIELIGEVIDPITKATVSSFNGDYILELRAAATPSQTLGDENSPFEYLEEKTLLFRGQGSVENGVLKGKFLIPNHLSQPIESGNLRILAWEEESAYRAVGHIKPILSQNPTPPNDQTGPEISPALEGKTEGPFVFNTTQIQVGADIFDLNGIQVSGQVPGQDLYLQVNDQSPIILNEEFLAINGSYEKGTFLVTVPGFSEGQNQLKIAAWDNLGNGSLVTIPVEIRGSRKIQILEHVVFPNPTTVNSEFIFTHNRPGENIQVSLEVFSMRGEILFSDSWRFVKAENQIRDLSWFFLQNQTKYPAKGTYIYRLSLLSEQDNSSDSVSGKIVIR